MQFLDQLREEIRQIVREELAAAGGALSSRGEYMSTAEAGQLAAVSQGTIRRWIREGRLTAAGAGRELRVRRDEIEALMSTGPRGRNARGFQQSPEALAKNALRRIHSVTPRASTRQPDTSES